MTDIKCTAAGDLDTTNSELSFVEGIEAIRQDIEMSLRTWLGETPYDEGAGVPYIQIIFKRGTTADAVRFIIEQKILSRDGVTDVLDLNLALDSLNRTATISGRALTDVGLLAFNTGAIA